MCVEEEDAEESEGAGEGVREGESWADVEVDREAWMREVEEASECSCRKEAINCCIHSLGKDRKP